MVAQAAFYALSQLQALPFLLCGLDIILSFVRHHLDGHLFATAEALAPAGDHRRALNTKSYIEQVDRQVNYVWGGL